VGDAPDELESALRDAFEADLCVVSGGLGPTHDDRTVEMVARAAGVETVVDPGLEAEIERVSRSFAERLGRPYADFAHGVRKQATLPRGAEPIGLAGTAPGFVLKSDRAAVVVLPGPPGELQRLWPAALATGPVRELLGRARPHGRRTLRLYGVSESSVARTLYEAGGDGDGLDITVCARDFEIHVDALAEPGAEARAEAVLTALRREHERHVFAEDERPVEEIVLGLCRALGLTLATAESCTGGLVSERLTRVPGASDVFLGGVVAYDDAVKQAQLGVPADLLRERGAVSAETAEAMADGVNELLGADVGLAVTGVAGPGGGTPEKPVGLVFVHVESPAGSLGADFSYPGDRESIRRRAAAAVLHLARRVLSQNRHEAA
jgi:nicotinamide-nucleotide amidase